MRHILLFINLIAFINTGYCQDSSSKKLEITSRLYIDAYYSYDFSRPLTKEKAPFFYNHKRHNSISANLALASISIKGKAVRSNLGLMAGSYSKYNLSNEPGLLRHLFEANVGVKLSKKSNTWLDMGIMPSHIGFESAISKDCWTTTRSILAENTPYYESGLKLTHTTKDDKLYASIMLLNGWQRSRILRSNLTPSFGTQLTYKPTPRLSINWSTFLGNVKPDSVSQWRYLNNFYAIYQLTKTLGITIGLDHGLEQKSHRSKNFNVWYSPILMLRFEKEKWAMAARMEYYNDKYGVIVPLVNNQFFQMQGYSFNVDRKIGRYSLCRLEWRYLNNASPYFERRDDYVKSNHIITASILLDLMKSKGL